MTLSFGSVIFILYLWFINLNIRVMGVILIIVVIGLIKGLIFLDKEF